ncbi:MAG: RNA methyltransferase [Myxococcota bacterium]
MATVSTQNGPAETAADRFVIVLVQPQHSGNIGSAARAMKNMGLHRLVVVDPPALDPMRVRWMAPGCDEVIAQMRIVNTVSEALEGCHRAIATTARHRKGNQPVIDPAQLAADHWDGIDTDQVTAVLFGREDFGLSREDVDRCAQVLRIPTPEHASLNLAQAVLLICHAWFEEGRSRGVEATGRSLGGRRGFKSTSTLQTTSERDERADLGRIEPAADAVVELLDRVGFTRGTTVERVRQTALSSLQNAGLTVRDTDSLRGMVSRLQWALDHPGEDWTSSRKKP